MWTLRTQIKWFPIHLSPPSSACKAGLIIRTSEMQISFSAFCFFCTICECCSSKKIRKRQKWKVHASADLIGSSNKLLPIYIFLVTFIYFYHLVWFFTLMNEVKLPVESKPDGVSTDPKFFVFILRCRKLWTGFSPIFNLFFLFILKHFLCFSCSQTVAPPPGFLKKQALVLFFSRLT